MNLLAWQLRLETHFRDLRARRRACEGSPSVFALEHDLPRLDREKLQTSIREHILREAPADEHWLVWVVYSTEIGYDYEGDEYWQTFEEQTPGWLEHGRRDAIRGYFEKFANEYSGVRPEGKWAGWFTIICWPITHAILPRDLQSRLAQLLYSMHGSFTAELLQNEAALGAAIEERGRGYSSRFQQLAENRALIGRIARALLLRRDELGEDLLSPEALNRIVSDLEHVQEARDWLHDARAGAQSVRGKGLVRSTFVSGLAPREDTTHGADRPLVGESDAVTRAGVEPRLVMRPITRTQWKVLLELPDLSPLLPRFPGLREALSSTRCIVPGSSNGPLPRRSLLYGSREVTLSEWPSGDGPLLQFDGPIPAEFEALLRLGCRIQPGPRWLLRIAADGAAHELSGRDVRPGGDYLLLSLTDETQSQMIIVGKHVEVCCVGVEAVRFQVPESVPDPLQEILQQAGLGLRRTIEVWPVGIAPSRWDGDGRIEWLSVDRPVIAIRADHGVDALRVSLAGETLEVRPESVGNAVIVTLPSLPVGEYKATVEGYVEEKERYERVGDLLVAVRNPRVWEPGYSDQGAFSVVLEPEHPSLEQLWDGRLAINIESPAGREARTTIKLFDGVGQEPIRTCKLPALKLPAADGKWQTLVNEFFENNLKARDDLDVAYSAGVVLDAGELGQFNFRCQRNLTPLRWAVRGTKNGSLLVLLNENGERDSPCVYRYELATPDVSRPVDAKVVANGIPVPRGALFCATTPGGACSIVLPPGIPSPRSRFRRCQRSITGVNEYVGVAERWAVAECRGNPFAERSRAQVLQGVCRQVAALIGGETWRQAEEALAFDSADCDEASRLRGAVGITVDGYDLAAWLDKHYLPDLAKAPVGGRVDGLGVLLQRAFLDAVPPEKARWLSEFALRLSSCPQSARSWAGDRFDEGVRALLNSPRLIRLARFLVLRTNEACQGSAGLYRSAYAGWEW